MNSHERRVDDRSLTLMQRVFEELVRQTSLPELVVRIGASHESIVSAIKRLQLRRALEPASCIDGVWLYRRRKDAERPYDRRGGARKEAA